MKKDIELQKAGKEEIESSNCLNTKPPCAVPKARAADRFWACRQRVHFLNLPFYETGTVKKNPLSQIDVDIIVQLLREVKPHQIYAAGDLADPHGTHRTALDAILRAYNIVDGG